MRISYHRDTDSLYMHLKESPTLESEEVAPGTVLHFDEDDHVTGIEIYYGAGEKVDLTDVEVIGLEDQVLNAQGQIGSWQPVLSRKHAVKHMKISSEVAKRHGVTTPKRASGRGPMRDSREYRKFLSHRAVA